MAPFRQKMGPPFFEKVESYDDTFSIDCLFIENCWREGDHLLPFMKNFHWISLELLISAPTAANFFAVIAFAYTELQASTSHCSSSQFAGLSFVVHRIIL